MENLEECFEKEITLSGFVEKVRNMQWVQFIVLRNNRKRIQVTIEKSDDKNKDLVSIVDTLTVESTIKVTGTLKKNENVKMGGMELIPSSIEVTSISKPELPISIKEKTNALRETRLDYRFLDLRRDDNNLLFNVQSYMEYKMREYWYNNGFTEIHTPKISASAAESGAEMFRLDYFGQKACLSQSPQFYKQMALAGGLNKVCEIGPVFRAENSHTSYHATEIEMIDVEVAWINSVSDVMDEEERWIKYFIDATFDKYGEDIISMYKVEKPTTNIDWPRIDFWDAKKILKEEMHYEGEVKEDFERKEEELMCEYAKKKYNSDFIFITNYPYSARSFYVMKDDNGVTQTYDLLFRGVEITSGAQREHRPEVLTKQIIEKGLDPKDLKFYIEFFEYGCPPHGGFGVGMARILMKVFNIDNIREATFIYRGPTRLNP